jgi:hypothetical protein
VSNVIQLPKLLPQIEIAPDWISARDQLLEDATGIADVNDDAAFAAAGELLRRLTKTSNAMEAFRKQYAEPYAEAVKIIKGAADTAREPLEKAKNRIQTAMNRYAEQQARLAEEERKRAEEEQRREVERRLAEQERARSEAEALGLDVPEMPPIEVTTETLPARVAPKADAVRVQQDVTWEVADEERVNRAFLSIDARKVNEWVRANKERVLEAMKDDEASGSRMLEGIVLKVKTKVISR